MKPQFACLLIAATLSLAIASPATAQTVAYTGATVETAGPEGRLENATLIVSGDTIKAVGTDVAIPADARVVSLTGKTILPGLVDPYFVYLQRPTATSTRTVTFGGRTFTVPSQAPFTAGNFMRVGDYFYPYKFDFMPAVRSGVTTANLVSDGWGLSAFADLSKQRSPEMLFETDGRMFAQVTNQTSALDIIRKPLAEKPSGGSGEAKTDSGNGDAKPGATPAPSRGSRGSSAANDAAKAYWEGVREGKHRLFVNMNTSAAVAYVLQIAKAHEKVKIVLVATGDNLYPLLDQIEELKNVEVVLQPRIDTVPFSQDLMNVAQMLQERKINFALSMSLSNSQLKASQDDPMFPVAALVHTGLDRKRAIESLTLVPATMLGLEKTHGSIATDRKANFLVFDGDPLSTGSRLEQVYLNGNKIHEN